MRSSNMVVLRGRTTSDIELLKTAGDTSYCVFKLAVDRPYRKGVDRKTDFIWLKAFRGNAEFLASYVGKGSLIGVTGEIRVNQWEEDGEQRSRTEIIVDGVEFAGPKQNRDAQQDHPSANNDDKNNSYDVMPDEEDDDLPF